MILENNLQEILQSNKCDYCGQLELKSHNSLFPSMPAVGFLPGFFLYYILDGGNARPYALQALFITVISDGHTNRMRSGL